MTIAAPAKAKAERRTPAWRPFAGVEAEDGDDRGEAGSGNAQDDAERSDGVRRPMPRSGHHCDSDPNRKDNRHQRRDRPPARGRDHHQTDGNGRGDRCMTARKTVHIACPDQIRDARGRLA